MLIKCPECENQISDKALSCPQCGYPMSVRASAPVLKTKKKFMRLPNGYGTIRQLKGKRRNPYAVYPPVIEYHENGTPVQRKALGYYATYNEAYERLALYHSENKAPSKHSFTKVFEQFLESPFCRNKSQSSIKSYKSGYKHLEPLWNEDISTITTNQMQNVIDNVTTYGVSVNVIKTLHYVFKYALQEDLITKDYSQFIVNPLSDESEKGVPFFEEELKILWDNRDNYDVQQIWVMILTGTRITEYLTMKYNEELNTLVGGVKTQAGKNRTIPVHTEITPFIANRYKSKDDNVRLIFYKTLESLGILYSTKGTKHTPHDCRHTFNWLCDKFNLSTTARHKLMGHSSGDMEIDVYGHKTIDELRNEIEKIRIKELCEKDYLVTN